MVVKKKFLALIIGLMSFGAMAQSPNDVVRAAADELEAGLEGRKEILADDRDALYEFVDQILLPRFDRRYAAQLVLGRHWRNASDEEREAFIDAFYGKAKYYMVVCIKYKIKLYQKRLISLTKINIPRPKVIYNFIIFF